MTRLSLLSFCLDSWTVFKNARCTIMFRSKVALGVFEFYWCNGIHRTTAKSPDCVEPWEYLCLRGGTMVHSHGAVLAGQPMGYWEFTPLCHQYVPQLACWDGTPGGGRKTLVSSNSIQSVWQLCQTMISPVITIILIICSYAMCAFAAIQSLKTPRLTREWIYSSEESYYYIVFLKCVYGTEETDNTNTLVRVYAICHEIQDWLENLNRSIDSRCITFYVFRK